MVCAERIVASGSPETAEVSICTSAVSGVLSVVGAALVLVGGAASGVGTGGGHMRLLVGAHFAIPVLEFLYFTLVIIA